MADVQMHGAKPIPHAAIDAYASAIFGTANRAEGVGLLSVEPTAVIVSSAALPPGKEATGLRGQFAQFWRRGYPDWVNQVRGVFVELGRGEPGSCPPSVHPEITEVGRF